jgi:hypothetical protein
MKFRVTFPFIDDMGSVSPMIVTRTPRESERANALWQLNSMREHDALRPLARLPVGCVFSRVGNLNDDTEATRIGKNIAKLLGLRMLTREGRYDTSVGTKTPAGLARTLARVMAGEEL